MKKCKILITAILTIVIAMSSKVYAGNLTLNNLKFESTVNEDGSMDVTEIWDISVEDTNTLYKTFKLDSDGFDGFSNAKVYEVSNDGTKKLLSQTNVEAYHVAKGSYYSLINSNNVYEITWGVSINTRQTKTYEISYTVENLVHKYLDCEEIYWQFIGEDFEIYAKNVEGIIYLPQNSFDMDDIRVWAHGDLNGSIEKISNNKIVFSVSNKYRGSILETRVVTPTGLFTSSNKNITENKLSSILAEETKWADEANAKREKAEKQKEMINKCINIFSILSGVFFAFKVIKYIKKLKATPKLKPDMTLDYYREVPENSTPADCSFMQGFMEGNLPNIVSATMLDLALKKAITFEIVEKSSSKKEIIVKMIKENIEELPKSEALVYDFLLKVVKEENSFTMKDLEKYIEKHISTFNKMSENIIKETKNKQVEIGNYDLNEEKKQFKYIAISIVYCIALFFFIAFSIMAFVIFDSGKIMLISTALLLVVFVLSIKFANRYSGFTKKGLNEKEMWKGLKKYMKDFSLLNEKEVPALVLWEKYLVYATVFGIAEKVLKQLKVKYPELLESDALNQTTYMYMMYNSGLNKSLASSITNSISSSYSTGNYSSGSGAGGGFSSGGRRRLRRLWRRRSLEIKTLK